MKAMKMTAAIVAAVLVCSAGQADVLYDFESGSQGWGAFGTPTTDSGVIPDGSVGQGRYHAANFDLGGWGMVDVSPATDLSAYTGMSVDVRFDDIPGYTPFSGTPGLDIGIEVGGSEYYAPAVVLTDSYVTYSVNFADILPGGSDLSGAIIKLRMLRGDNAGVGRLDYDQVTGIPEPMSLLLLGVGAMVLRRR